MLITFDRFSLINRLKINGYVVLLCLFFFNAQRIKAQNNTAAAIAGVSMAAGIAALAVDWSIEDYKKQLEHNAAEYLMNETFEKNSIGFDLKTIDISITDKKDLSSVKLNVFGLKYDSEGLPFNGNKMVLIQKCSNGWVSPTGLNIRSIQYYKIDQALWNKIIMFWMNNLNEETEDNIQFPKTFEGQDSPSDLSTLKNIILDDLGNYNFVFWGKTEFKSVYHVVKINGPMYLMEKVNQNFNVALEKGRFSLYFPETGDLVNIQRKEVLEITRFLNQPTGF
jgi:hypothetical protein